MSSAVPNNVHLLNRRQWLHVAAAGLGAAFPLGCTQRRSGDQRGSAGPQSRFPGKVAMRVLNDRPPNLETPWRYFRQELTPNDAFFVRWHLQFLPTSIDLRTWRLKVAGEVTNPQAWSMDELRRLEPASVVAVNQCSGNSRGLFEPHMPGGQWGNGAMGNARWTGVRLRDLLRKSGAKSGAVEVTFAGMDRGGYSTVPDFTKSLTVERALAPEILVAYEMNGEPLPLLNGFPVRLIVPGWYGTYWVKALSEINVLAKPFDGFWMSKAYRIPMAANGVEEPGRLAEMTIPINRLNVRSFLVTPDSGARVALGQSCLLEGIAFDGGDGIQTVELSWDGGTTWYPTELAPDLGRFAFRRWRLAWRPERTGAYRLQVRGTNRAGETQPATPGWNRSGYMRNVIEELALEVA